MIMKVDLYFAGKEGLVIATYLSKKLGIKYDTPEAGIISMNSVDLDSIPELIFNKPELAEKIEIREIETGRLIHPEDYHA